MKIINENSLLNLIQNKVSSYENLLMVGPSKINELNCLDDEKVIKEVHLNLKEIFSFVKTHSLTLMKRRIGTIAFFINASTLEGGEMIYSPVYNSAIKSFMKSLAKEMNPFHVNVICITLPLTRMKKSTRKYDLVTLKYKGESIEEQVVDVLKLIDIAEVLNGQIISLGTDLDL
ncbi:MULTISPECIES: SDR family NAD(P)-dependent oxidoreductase [Limosilactobacillus]|uniref:SDR family NAD(P)-dependent oxidoreductase n=1 Tax=Limosilactobacillus reuteri TaxID=1598 RepID=A0AAX2ST85_LIMRT|nr:MULTISPECIES: SDR family NAD(P)-dependent oxidoreductase [Limosilactobacillus]MBB1110743.1 SDR family NAD(P)-dependent oxidoreductase [Limosilactobacillus balticus]RMX26255.1 hypothetical protein C6H63_08460 [Limosilactobacillus reuteri]TGB10645.1 SDR family NAD(P)-dependent oxidoreductase [Limosilactobacillus reuteri]